MSDFDRIIELSNAPTIQEGVDLPRISLHKWLILGQTEYVCRYGTLSDGHEKITDAQKYAQAIKEQYMISLNIRRQRAVAKRAQSNLLEAKEKYMAASTDIDRLRAEADIEDAETALLDSLITIEDQSRMVETYSKVRMELGPKVEQLYPDGIEQAELDNWKAVLEYRMIKEKVPGVSRQQVDNIPLPIKLKAELGYRHGRFDAIAPLAATQPALCYQIEEQLKLEKN